MSTAAPKPRVKPSAGAHTWTVRTIAALTKDGWMAVRVEHWDHFSRRRHDLFGFLDVLAVRPGYPTRGIQVCAHSAGSTRMNKILDAPAAGILLSAGWWLEVWGWKKDGRLWTYVARNVSDEAAKRMTREGA
jgi:hypothetical protein